MIKLPVSKTTFQKTFLEGKGTVEIHADDWTLLFDDDEPFTPNVADIAEIGISVASGDKQLKIGSKQGLQVTVSATGSVDGSIRLIWPQQQDELLETYGVASFLTDDQLYAAISLNGSAEAAAGVNFPSGPLSASFNADSGGHVSFTRLMLFDQSTGARTLLKGLASAPILPQNVDVVAEIPAPGEVLSLRYGGYLQVRGGLNWGYSFAGVKSAEINDLDLALSYTARAAASMSLGYRLGGEFDIEARRGSNDGWVRFVVRKSRSSAFDFAADFGLDANFSLDGLPESADDFLAALLDTDVESALGYLEQATELTDLEALPAKLDGLAVGFLQDLAQEWIGKALDNSTMQEFLEIAREVVDTYRNLDQRIIEIYESYLDKVSELTSIFDNLDQVTSREGFENLSDSAAWKLLERLYGDQIFDLLLDDDKFDEFRELVTEAKNFLTDGAHEKIRQFVAKVKERLGLASVIEKLEKVSGPESLQALADREIEGLVGRVLGKAFDKIKSSEVGDAADKIHDFLDKVQEFKDDYYQKLLEKVTAQSVSMSLNYRFSRATSRDALFDVEVNLMEKAGRDLARAAGRGDFREVFTTYDPKILRVHKGVMTSNFERSSHLQINLFGWGLGSAVDVLQKLEHSIESEPGGLIHVYTLNTQIKQAQNRGRRFKEETESNFLLQAIGASIQPAGSSVQVEKDRFLVQTLRKLAVEYDLVKKDVKTTAKELTQYLSLAEDLALIRSREEVVAELEREFPDGFGSVKARYVVRYDDQAVRSVFAIPNERMKKVARQTTRQLIGTRYTAEGPSSQLARVGFAYLNPAYAKLHDQATLLQDGKGVTLPAWFTPSGLAQQVSLAKVHRHIVNTLFNVEDTFIKHLVAFDAAIDKAVSAKQAVPVKELQKTSRRFIKMSSKLEKFTPGDNNNTLFGVFDRLVREGGGGKGRRESAMILEITPPEGETVTKYFMA